MAVKMRLPFVEMLDASFGDLLYFLGWKRKMRETTAVYGGLAAQKRKRRVTVASINFNTRYMEVVSLSLFYTKTCCERLTCVHSRIENVKG